MSYTEYDVSLTEDTFFNTLTFSISASDIISYMKAPISHVLKQHSISEYNVKEMCISHINKKCSNYFRITIKFFNIDNVDLQGMNEETKIRTVLKHMGYADIDIKSISYRQKGRPNNFAWYIRLSDPNYDFDLDESYSARDYEIRIYKKLKEVLGFEIDIDFI